MTVSGRTIDSLPESHYRWTQMATTDLPPAAPRLASVLGAAGRGLITTGVIVLLFVVFQLWGTDFQAARSQNHLRDDLDQRLEDAAGLIDIFLTEDPVVDDQVSATTTTIITAPDSTTTVTTAGESATTTTNTVPGGYNPEVLALFFPEDGDAVARIQMPTIDVDKIVVHGVAVSDLRKGPGHYSESSLPGSAGNTAIAGHRTTWGKPFNRVDELAPGDEIVVTSVSGEFRYRVLDPLKAFEHDLELIDSIGNAHIIVKPSATWVLDDFGDDRLTLTACHPKLSSRQRIIVAAELIDDVVELPEWLIEANAAHDSETGTETLPSDSDESIVTAPTGTEPTDTTGTSSSDEQGGAEPTSAVDLDEGLNGERDAIPGAVGWMIGALAFWYAGGWIGRRWLSGPWGRAGARFAGLIPAALCLWFSFEMIDRALPAG